MERSAKRPQGDQTRSMERSAKRPQGDQARSTEESASGNDGTAGGASSTHTSTDQEVATSPGYDYEVFLSFRGPDTRAGFTDFLYTILKDAGIRTFRDDEELRIGEEFAPKLLQAINQSKISIPIFSNGYASSPWCLKELVKMVECRKNGIQTIMPIYYDVAPSDVRHQLGGYAEAFRSHEKKQRYDEETIHKWKAALRAVGEINGWDLHGKPDRREGEFAKEVTEKVFRELKKAHLEESNCLVGVDNRVDEIMEMIGAQTSETWIIGIHGMGGVGKTTIAKSIYNRLSSNFNDRCFLSNIRETSKGKGVECLQKQLISDILKMKETNINNVDEGTGIIKDRLHDKRVLLLLDDVEKECHIDAFVGKRDWFGRGSRIIITTRNKDILCFSKVDCSYELKCMDPIQSLKLFSTHAFRRDSPLDEDINQSNRAIDIAGGLPLALVVIGSLLSRTEKNKWDGKLKKLENIPHEDVLTKLKISYEALRDHEQRIFLDIACLFIGYEKDVVIYFWDESIFFPKEAMDVLENMSLMKIVDDNEVWMHDLVRDLGRQIVRQKSNYKIEEQSRLWDPEEALGLLRRQKKKEKLEALRLRLDHQHCFAYEDFERLPNLNFLEVCNSKGTFRAEERLLWHASPSNVLPTNEDSHLLPELRWLSWHKIPPTFKITNFSMKDVVILDLSHSKITHHWKGWSHVKVIKNLKVMNLTSCIFLERTPKFSVRSKLERLILTNCKNLVKIDKSICQLKSLVLLDVAYCVNLQRLPDKIGDLASLKYLNMSDCGSLEGLPNTIGNLKSLNELNISHMNIKELPDTLWTIEKLEVIKATFMRCLKVEIDNRIYRNRSLRILNLSWSYIHVVSRLPESLTILDLNTLYIDIDTFLDLSNLTNLKELHLSLHPRDCGWRFFGPMPVRIGNLSKLESLSLCYSYATTIPIDMRSFLPQLKSLELRCRMLDCLPSLPSSLLSLVLYSNEQTTLPTDMSSLLPRLQSLSLECPLRCLPRLPSSLLSLSLEYYPSDFSMEDLSHLTTLSTLCISLHDVSKIRGLDRSENQQVSPDRRNLNKLRYLAVCYCRDLVGIEGELPQSLESLRIIGCTLRKLPDLPQSLESLWIEDCKFLQKLPDLSYLKTLSTLHISRNLVEIQGELPQSLESLWIEDCESLQKLPDLSNLKTLSTLHISCCAISEIRGLDHSENQQVSPDLRNLNKLRNLTVSYCRNLVEIQGELPQSLESLWIKGCISLQKLPDLSNLKGLRKVTIISCGKLVIEEISRLCSEKGVEFVTTR